MDRKEFLCRSLQLGAGCTALALFAGRPVHADEEEQAPSAESEAAARRAAFTTAWVGSLVENMDDQLDEKARIALLNACGRACAERGAKAMAKAHKGNVDGLVAQLKANFSEGRIEKEGDTVTMSWDQCLCPLVTSETRTVSGTFCHCSEGWMHEMFETAAEKAVAVEMVETIQGGAERCTFRVRV